MNYALSIVTLFLTSSLAWIVLSRRRYAPNLESLLGQLRRPSGKEIGPGVSHIQEQRAEDDRLWAAIRGGQGMYRMLHNAGILLTLATRMSEECDPRTELQDRNSDLALMLRVAVIISILESVSIKLFPGLPVPRLIARFAFDQYCELCASVRAMIEFHHPTLVERFDRVV